MAPPKPIATELGMGTARNASRVSLAVLMAAVLFATFTFISTNESHAASCETAPSACLRWNMTYDGENPSLDPNKPGFSDDFADDMDAGGGRVYVTGRSFGNSDGDAYYATVAYDGPTGAEEWVAEESGNISTLPNDANIVYNGPKSLVIVTAEIHVNNDLLRQYLTIAYDAATGDEKWRAHQCPAQTTEACPSEAGTDTPTDIDVSPDGEVVVVTGETQRPTGNPPGQDRFNFDFLTIAYDADNGAELWRHKYNGAANGYDFATHLDVTADRVYVTGWTRPVSVPSHWTTVAYPLSGGNPLWANTTAIAGEEDEPYDIEASGARVFVTGDINGAIATISYAASDGTEQWRHLFTPANTLDTESGGIQFGGLAVNPAGTHLFVTGTSGHAERGSEITTLRYPVEGPTPTATAIYQNTGNDFARDITVGTEHGQTRVFVTGELRSSNNLDIVVLGYEDNLTLRWERVRGGASNDQARRVALNSPNDLDSVFSSGSVHSPGRNFDYDTAAYDASVQPSATPTGSASASASTTPTPTPTPTASRTTTPTPRPTVTTTPSSSPSPSPAPTTTPPPRRECNDSIDNDADGQIDLQDPDCENRNDNSESSAPERCADVTPGTRTPRAGGGMVIGGTSGNDQLVGTAGDDLICGFDGGDTIEGLGGNDRIRAGRGIDTVEGGAGEDRMFGGHGADDLRGNDGGDIIRGRVGNDLVAGGDGADQVWGGGGDDRVLGNRGGDDLFGGRGNDSLDGGRGVDTCVPGPGRDRQRSC